MNDPGARSGVFRLLACAYGRLAVQRRAWHARHPSARHALARPVVSVGNLSVGGSGKTPLVAALASLLVAAGERPSVLSRGYGRRCPADGVLVVSDGRQVLEGVGRAGDEPLMLARQLAGVAVLVAADRYLAGTLAEHRLGCTVHLLDDGFQHLALERDIDLLLLGEADTTDAVLPAGRLREPLDVGCDADAWLVPASAQDAFAEPDAIMGCRNAKPVFTVETAARPPLRVHPWGHPAGLQATRAVALAGIARPGRFFESARASGWELAEEIAFPDHHRYGTRDLNRVVRAARAAAVDVVLTTEKDAVRLEDAVARLESTAPRFLYLPIAAQPSPAFRNWLLARLAAVRTAR